jgi:hypothetical protein
MHFCFVGVRNTQMPRLLTRLHNAKVLDCGSFLADYASRAPVVSRPELGEGGGLRPVVDLLVEQLECVRGATLCCRPCIVHRLLNLMMAWQLMQRWMLCGIALGSRYRLTSLMIMSWRAPV